MLIFLLVFSDLTMNIQSLCKSFVECEYFLGSNSLDIVALCDTNLDDSINSGNFSVRGCLPLIQRDSTTHMHGFVVYVKQGYPFAWDFFCTFKYSMGISNINLPTIIFYIE